MNKLCIGLVLAVLIAGITPVLALTDSIAVTVGTGTTKTANLISFSGGNVISEVGLCDATTANQCAAVKAGNTAAITDVSVVVSDPNVVAAINAVGAASIPTGTNSIGGVTVANGANVVLGNNTDGAACTSGTSLLACMRQVDADIKGPIGAGTAIIGYNSNDVCTYQTKTNLPISQNGTSSVQLVALSGSTAIYVCSLSLIAAGATTVALTTGTGTACVTGNAAVVGTTTASIANSMSLAANGGFTLGNGTGTIAKGAASSELCMVLGTNVFVAGNLTYVQQ